MDMASDPNYQKFVAEQAKHCSCSSPRCPCDGVLAGGLCDNFQDDEDDDDDWWDQWDATAADLTDSEK